MSRDVNGILRHWDATPEEIRQAMELAVDDAIREHKAAGRSIIVWDKEKNQAVEIPAELIEVPDEDPAPASFFARDNHA